MGTLTKDGLKLLFTNGRKPSAADFTTLIDSFYNIDPAQPTQDLQWSVSSVNVNAGEAMKVSGNVYVCGEARLSGKANFTHLSAQNIASTSWTAPGDDVSVSGKLSVGNDIEVSGDVTCSGSVKVSGNLACSGSVSAGVLKVGYLTGTRLSAQALIVSAIQTTEFTHSQGVGIPTSAINEQVSWKFTSDVCGLASYHNSRWYTEDEIPWKAVTLTAGVVTHANADPWVIGANSWFGWKVIGPDTVAWRMALALGPTVSAATNSAAMFIAIPISGNVGSIAACELAVNGYQYLGRWGGKQMYLHTASGDFLYQAGSQFYAMGVAFCSAGSKEDGLTNGVAKS